MEEKRILLVAPTFYNYHTEIKKELEKQGYIVDYFDDRPSKNPFIKGFIKGFKSKATKLLDSYMLKIVNKTKQYHYYCVFFVANIAFEVDQIKQLRKSHPEATYILYLWDSIKNYPHNIGVLHLFDKVYSFDRDDCQKYKMKFLPLFYCDKYKKLACKKQEKYEYDIASICVAHPIRYPIVGKLLDYSKSKQIRLFSYMYLQSSLLFIYNKCFVKVFRDAKYSEFNYRALSEREVLKVIESSKIVFDICNKNQIGLTMRSIEALGSQRKLITTNKDIVNYDFFDKNNIHVFDLESFEIPSEFLETEYHEINENIYKKYSLSSWINTIFGEIQ